MGNCFWAVTTELSRYSRDYMARKPKILLHGAYSKHLLSPALNVLNSQEFILLCFIRHILNIFFCIYIIKYFWKTFSKLYILLIWKSQMLVTHTRFSLFSYMHKSDMKNINKKLQMLTNIWLKGFNFLVKSDCIEDTLPTT